MTAAYFLSDEADVEEEPEFELDPAEPDDPESLLPESPLLLDSPLPDSLLAESPPDGFAPPLVLLPPLA